MLNFSYNCVIILFGKNKPKNKEYNVSIDKTEEKNNEKKIIMYTDGIDNGACGIRRMQQKTVGG